MKLWYQSMARLDQWGGYEKTLKRILDGVKETDTEIEVHGITKIGGVAEQFRYLEFLETSEVLENVHQAVERGFDAFLIGNICDPGLREAREIVDIPVLGLCETSLHIACLMGASFSIVTINDKFTPRALENVTRYGLREKLNSVKRMRVDRLLDLGRAFDEPDIRKEILSQFEVAANETTAEGAEVVIAAGGVAMALLADAKVYKTTDGVPVLNGITTLVKMGETAVRLNRIMGGFTSKRLEYAPPSSGQIAEIRKFYGNVYPGIDAQT